MKKKLYIIWFVNLFILFVVILLFTFFVYIDAFRLIKKDNTEPIEISNDSISGMIMPKPVDEPPPTLTNDKAAYTEDITDEIILNDMTIRTHIITASNHKEEASIPFLEALIKFPQIHAMYENVLSPNANKLLRDVAIETVGYGSADETLKLFDDIINNGVQEFWSGDNEYEMIYAVQDYISVNYNGMFFSGGAHPVTFSDYVTVDINDGKLMSFTDYFSKENIIEATQKLNFEIVEGHYDPGGWIGSEPEIVDGFVEAISELEIADSLDMIYNPHSTQNFAMDNQYVYIQFYFYDSLYGYVVLRFNRDDL